MRKSNMHLLLGFLAVGLMGCGGNERQTENLTATVQNLPMPGAARNASMTVYGRLIDTRCYGMDHANVEDDHDVIQHGETMQVPACATACASMTIPVALLKDGQRDGEVLVLLAPSNQLADHMAKQARVTGAPAFDGGILPQKIEVLDADGNWVEVHLAAMM